MKSVMIDGVEFVEKSAATGGVKIVVLDRGFVVVGNVSEDGEYVVIENCSCIRVWGTSVGLGQIASDGPTASTKLDRQPTTRVHKLQVVMIIDCVEEKWKL